MRKFGDGKGLPFERPVSALKRPIPCGNTLVTVLALLCLTTTSKIRRRRQEVEMNIDVAVADHLLTTTRGIRRRMDFARPVDISIIDKCIEVAIQAPVGDPDMGAHFIVITEPELRRSISELYCKALGPYCDEFEAAELESTDASEHDRIRKVYSTYRWHGENLYRAPVLIIVAMQGRYENLGVRHQTARYGSILPAAWSLMLALRARGLGSCWTTLHVEYERETAEFLGAPEDITQAVLMPVGYYTGSDFKPAKRPPASRYIHYNGWAQ